jgi:hypothetical protein
MISDKNGAYGPESIWATSITGPPQKGLPAPISRGSGPYIQLITGVLRVRLKSYAKARPNGEHPLQHDVFLEK